MNFRCSELHGATYQPKEVLEIDNCWIIPACKGGPVLYPPDLKLIFVYGEDISKDETALTEYLFVHVYQFLFCHYSDIYRRYSLRQINRPESFILSGTDICDIEKQIRSKYVQQDTELSKDFTNIDIQYCSLLPHRVNFQEFYRGFVERYNTNNKFKEIITLFCETNNGLRPLYNNVLEQIARLQTIFETLLGKPKTSRCCHCGMETYVEDLSVFYEKCLNEYGITDPNDISLIVKVKKTLNKVARVKYIHHSDYYNPNELRNIAADIQADGYSDYRFDIEQVLKKQTRYWKTIDWENVYAVYLVCVRNLIYARDFLS